ncbi:MAG: class I adenylate-forming enzyme family protein [Pseudomonadota bacterium]
MHRLTANPDRVAEFESAGWWGTETLSSLFTSTVQKATDAVALADPANREALTGGPPQRLTYAELDEACALLARQLYAAGLRQGDRVVVQLPNTVEIILTYLAAAQLGLVVSPVAVQYREHELRHVGETVRPKAYITCPSLGEASFAESNHAALPTQTQRLDFDLSAASCRLTKDGQELSADPDGADEYLASLTQSANDIYTICWTSGTTGRPKGVPRSHNHWLSSTLASEDAIGLSDGDVMLCPFPFVNMAALGGFLYYWLKIRGTLVLHHPFDPMVFLKQIAQEKVVYTVAPPAVLNLLLQRRDELLAPFDLSSLKTIGSGSAPLAPDMVAGFKTHTGIDIINLYGSNEGAAMISNPADVPDPRERALYFPRFGRPEFSWKNRAGQRQRTELVDLESRDPITEPGKSGELLIAGPSVFDGYFESPEDNAEAFENGFFRTGDLFEIVGPENQYYRFVGRCKDIIVRGGVKISPEELDEVIQSHPQIAEGAVCAYEDATLGEKVCAVVVPVPEASITLEGLVAHFQERQMAKFKWPERLVVLEALPRNAMNKVVRSALADMVAQG